MLARLIRYRVSAKSARLRLFFIVEFRIFLQYFITPCDWKFLCRRLIWLLAAMARTWRSQVDVYRERRRWL
jgi:hypothetical protein